MKNNTHERVTLKTNQHPFYNLTTDRECKSKCLPFSKSFCEPNSCWKLRLSGKTKLFPMLLKSSYRISAEDRVQTRIERKFMALS